VQMIFFVLMATWTTPNGRFSFTQSDLNLLSNKLFHVTLSRYFCFTESQRRDSATKDFRLDNITSSIDATRLGVIFRHKYPLKLYLLIISMKAMYFKT
jgi:hypothetical protein